MTPNAVSDAMTTTGEKVLPLSRGRTQSYPQVTATTATLLPPTETAIYLGLCHHCHPTATASTIVLPLPPTLEVAVAWQGQACHLWITPDDTPTTTRQEAPR